MRPNNNKCSKSFDERLHRHLVTATDGKWICLTLTPSQSDDQIHVSKEPYIRWGPDPPQEGALLRGTAMRLFVKLLWPLVILLLLSCIPCMQCIRCSLFLQMLHVAWSVCLFVSKRTVKMAAIHRPASNGIAKMAIDSILQSRLQWFMILHMTLLVRAFSKFKAESYQSDTFAILQLWPCCSYNWL